MKFFIRCLVFPTEDSELIMRSLLRFFPHSEFTISSGDRERWIEATSPNSEAIEKLRSIIHELRIIDAVRRVVSKSWTGSMFTLRLDKQAAVRNKIRIIDESDTPPLGSIEITGFCESDEAYDSFLNWFTPPTKDGKIIKN